jgi:hypothetical protein
MIGELEVMSDRDGAVVVGWVAPQVFYVQFVEFLSGALGMRFAMRLEKALVNSPNTQIFFDCSGLDSYDFPARDAYGRVLFCHRRRLTSCLLLARTRVVELGMQAIAVMLGANLMEVTNHRAEFLERLDRAAPTAWRSLRNPRAWVPAKPSLPPET